MKKQYYVISHTHWDREWYKPFEIMRLNLNDLIDRVLDLIDKYPSYVFHLDEQTVVIEDYLQLGGKNEERLKKAIKNGNIIIGPWYLQNDFYSVSGESVVRNLLFGREICESYGIKNLVGYMPDQFGLISQLPQILKDFDIDVCMFGRGYHFFDDDDKLLDIPSEFIWQAPDGSRITAIFLRFWYNNAQHVENSNEFKARLVDMTERYGKCSDSPYILLMNGVDHLFAQPDVLEQINGLKTEFDIKQSSLTEYCDRVKEFYADRPLTVYGRELRAGNDYQILKGCLSSRISVKANNVRAQCILENVLEPLCVMTRFSSSDGRSVIHEGILNYLWKILLKGQAHDNICGCSTDAVYRHMADGYERFFELSRALTEKAMCRFAEGLEQSEEITVYAANTSQYPKEETLRVEVPLDKEKKYALYCDGIKKEYSIIGRKKVKKTLTSPYNLPSTVNVETAEIAFSARLDAFSFNSFQFKQEEYLPDCISKVDRNYIRNGKIGVRFKDGIEIFNEDKSVKLYFLDVGDKGDSYVHIPTENSCVFDLSNSTVDVSICKNLQIMCVKGDFLLPEYYDFKNNCRSASLVRTFYELTFTLKGDRVELDYCIQNNSRDHKLALVMNTGLNTNKLIADTPYDIVGYDESYNYKKTMSKAFANTSFAANYDEVYFAALTEGQMEDEQISKGAFSITLLRATGVISRTESGECAGGENWVVNENQCLGSISGRTAFCFCDSLDAILRNVSGFRVKTISYIPNRYFDKDRQFTLQTGDLNIYSYDDGYVSKRSSVVEIVGECISVAALKPRFKGEGYIIRLVNFDDKKQIAKLIFSKGRLYNSNMSEMLYDEVSNCLNIEFAPKEIKTFMLLD